MPRLRRVRVSAVAGITRRRRGRGWTYHDAAGARVRDPDQVARIDALVIPPAWRDVWICPMANGHVQATGFDARGRRQYRYHDQWRRGRDTAKFERMLDFAESLPQARATIAADLAGRGPTRRRVLAAATRLLELGFFRVGGERYAAQNQTFGLATMRRSHVTVSRSGELVFSYPAKSGRQRVQPLVDDPVRDVVATLKRRRGGGDSLLAYRTSRGWVNVRSEDLNDYLREITGGDYSTKDFRTWNATVLASVALSMSTRVGSATARKRAVTRAVREVADYLGNTPAVCRGSYVDPRVIDLYEDGVTIAAAVEQVGADSEFGSLATQGSVEAAVLELLREPATSRRRAS